jgi:GMP synthase (glutamine-hydrolysing)
MKLKLVEPLRELFKDEVRALGRELGCPSAVWPPAVPRPGPRHALPRRGHRRAPRRPAQAPTRSIEEEIRAAGLYDDLAGVRVLLPVRSVGVMGDDRTYERSIAPPRRHLADGMTADWVPLPYESWAASRAASSTRCAASTAWSTTSRRSRPATIEWE